MAPSILVLEDDPDMREILASLLEDQGYQVVAVENGQAAVTAAREKTFDLTVADIRMEGMDGLEAVAQTRLFHPEIGAIVLSGYSSPEETGRARQLNVAAYLKKPFDMNKFLEVVHQELTARLQARQRTDRGFTNQETMIWALESLWREADGSESPYPPDTLATAAHLSEGLARSLGLSAEVSQEIRAPMKLNCGVRNLATNMEAPNRSR